jgi:hypothetical protein
MRRAADKGARFFLFQDEIRMDLRLVSMVGAPFSVNPKPSHFGVERSCQKQSNQLRNIDFAEASS